MLEKVIIISLLVFAIWYTMQPGEIFSFISKWLHPLHDKLKQPIFDCPVCMVPWHGTYLYWLIPWESFGFWPSDRPVIDWLVTIIAAMGLNAVTIRFFRTDEIEITNDAIKVEVSPTSMSETNAGIDKEIKQGVDYCVYCRKKAELRWSGPYYFTDHWSIILTCQECNRLWVKAYHHDGTEINKPG